ncbi:TIGR02221 family CRISPR-associated protein [Candidatus Micrarchaeota archaeon]|nr:TIGR02221 family CRISPR-associated protein [Candidatus Micrarchaeota archaeon]
MSNVYISVLGTNDYLPCVYYHENGFEAPNVRFIQEATIKMLCADWTKEDRVLILTTDKAYQRNWLDDGHVSKEGEILKRKGLGSILENTGVTAKITQIKIPEGKNEDEIWEIFQILYDSLKPNDRVSFDITHSFRSLPLLATVVIHYAKTLKSIEVDGIYYGAFEILGHHGQVREMPIEKRRAPIIDLLPFDALLDWSVAIDKFLDTGSAKSVCQLANDAVKPILKRTKGKDDAAQAIKRVANTLAEFSSHLATCRGPELSCDAIKLKLAIEECLQTEIIPAFKPLVSQMEQEVRSFQGKEVADGLMAAKWCYDHNLIQQSYTILEETLISFMVYQAGLDDRERDHRMITGQAAAIFTGPIAESDWLSPAADYKDITKSYLGILIERPDLAKVFIQLQDDRNDLNHAGWRKDPTKAKTFLKNLPKLIERAQAAILEKREV